MRPPLRRRRPETGLQVKAAVLMAVSMAAFVLSLLFYVLVDNQVSRMEAEERRALLAVEARPVTPKAGPESVRPRDVGRPRPIVPRISPELAKARPPGGMLPRPIVPSVGPTAAVAVVPRGSGQSVTPRLGPEAARPRNVGRPSSIVPSARPEDARPAPVPRHGAVVPAARPEDARPARPAATPAAVVPRQLPTPVAPSVTPSPVLPADSAFARNEPIENFQEGPTGPGEVEGRFTLGPGLAPALVMPVDRTLTTAVVAMLCLSNLGLVLLFHPASARRRRQDAAGAGRGTLPQSRASGL